jgi:hypothetical protein
VARRAPAEQTESGVRHHHAARRHVGFGAQDVLDGVDLVVGAGHGALSAPPGDHLDIEAIEQLEAALDGYGGTLLLVTHDRRLAEAVRVDRTVDVRTLAAARR